MGKIEINDLRSIIEKHRDTIVEYNGLGWDYSMTESNGTTIIGKIEPMVYYNFISPAENAKLSVIFALNDFLTSGLIPEFALIDFESVGQNRKDFMDYVEKVIYELGRKKVKLLAAHTGEYGNISQGVSGSISLISLNKKPKYSLKKIQEDYKIFVAGTLGKEYKYFLERKSGIDEKTTFPEDLSIEDKIKCFNEHVYYVHDLSEGGLYRGLLELEEILGHGFSLNSKEIKKLKIAELTVEKAIEASSSGSVIILADGNYEKPEYCKMINLERAEKGILLDGEMIESNGDVILDIFKNK